MNNIMTNVTRGLNRAGLQLKKHSPEILVIAGVVGAVTSAIMACRATTKLKDITDEAKENIEDIHAAMEHPESMPEDYTEKDGQKDLTTVYVQTGVKLAKLYGPSIILGGLSITAILTSNNILRKRNIALASAYMGVSKAYDEYRGRVVERFGKAVDRELKYNIKAKEIEETVVDENGNETVEKKVVDVVKNDLGYSPYARFYDDGCTGWTKDPEANLMFLRMQQDAANKRLERRGHLFLNEVYDMLGIPHSKEGQLMGWLYDKNAHEINRIDFGIYDGRRESNRNFVNGYERTILLDFNVDPRPIIDEL